jgi:hypothetical protein
MYFYTQYKYVKYFSLSLGLTLHFNSVEIPTRCSFVIEFIIPKFIEGSTCFERHTARHHQELCTVFAACGLYTYVVNGRCQG